MSEIESKKKVLILGASGMLGNAIFRYFHETDMHQVYGTLRSLSDYSFFLSSEKENLIVGLDVSNFDSVANLLSHIKPDVVINCIGVVKQSEQMDDMLDVVSLNSMLPHRLSMLCDLVGSRLIHVSTDCVFTGKNGMYKETDVSDSCDSYGASKRLGEVIDRNSVTIRTSIIGHEIRTNKSLVDWFLGSEGEVQGYKRAVFSGLPTITLAKVLHDYVVPKPELEGLFHLSVAPISKYKLLKKINETYKTGREISKNESFVIDRSLDSTKFRLATGWIAPDWDSLVDEMHCDYKKVKLRNNNV